MISYQEVFKKSPAMRPIGSQLDRRFFDAHPFRIDLLGGFHVRFSTLHCAARTALHVNRPVWDECTSQQTTVRECRALVPF